MPQAHHPETAGGKAPVILLVLLAAGLAVALLWMLNLRLSEGDTYPPYSSLRTDPLGARALYQALDQLDDTSTQRHTRRAKFIDADGQSSLLFLGLSPDDLTVVEAGGEREMIDGWLENGAQLVISLKAIPETYEERQQQRREKLGKQEKDKPQADEEAPESDEEEAKQKDSIADDDHDRLPGLFGLVAKRAPEKGEGEKQVAEESWFQGALPVWHGSHIIEIHPESDWKKLAGIDEQVTIAQLKRGGGTIIVTTDSYPFSNEAQVLDRHPGFILALIGDHRRVIFDESHLGVSNEPGLMSLVRRYHLHGVIIGGLLLFVLLLWQGGGSLIPVNAARDLGIGTTGAVTGRDSADGLVALLESGLKPRAVLTECIDRHLATATRRRPSSEAVEQARAVAEQARHGKVAEDFTRISKILDKPQS